MDDKKEIRRQALREVIRFCGSIQAYSDRLELTRGRVSHWLNQDIHIPYEHAIVTEEFSRISLDRLSPFTEKANQVIKSLHHRSRLIPVELPIKDILLERPGQDQRLPNDGAILVDAKGVLIAGFEQLRAYKALGMEKILAVVIDTQQEEKMT